jgi:HSP20 family molecular chaperone IbpA
MGAEDEHDVELLVVGGELIVKAGTAHRTHIALPAGADAAGVFADLAAGSLDVHVPRKQ